MDVRDDPTRTGPARGQAFRASGRATTPFPVLMSNSLLVLLRRDVGYGLMEPRLFGLFALMGAAGFFVMGSGNFSGDEQVGGLAAMLTGGLMAVSFLGKRHRSWQATSRPDSPIHSMSRGYSYRSRFRTSRIPEWFLQRWVEPVAVIGGGLSLALLAHWSLLGCWLVVAGLCHASVEAEVHRAWQERVFRIQDRYTEADMLRLAAPAHTKPPVVDSAAAGRADSAAVSSPDLDRLRAAKRKEEQDEASRREREELDRQRREAAAKRKERARRSAGDRAA